jgi:small subunit ribosomal protein S8
MNMTDPIADMLTRVRNASSARHEFVLVPNSKMKANIAKILREEGFIRGVEVVRDNTQGTLKIYLNYLDKKTAAISGLRRVSKPGLRVYVNRGEIPRVYGGLGIAILSTPKGIMTGQHAWRNQVGGELLCYVW